MVKGMSSATLAAIKSKWVTNATTTSASAVRKAKYAAQNTDPMTLPISFLDGFQRTTKPVRTLEEQIQHLRTTTSSSKSVKGRFYECSTPKEQFTGEIFTRPDSNNRWLKIGDELYFIREESESKLHNLFDEMYSSLNLQTLKPTNAQLGHGFNRGDKIQLYKYIEADAKITDNPTLINEGFGLDCLLSTPLSNKSVIVKNGKAIRTENGLMDYFGTIDGGIVMPRKMITGDVNISSYFAQGTESSQILRNMTEIDLLQSLRKLDKLDSKIITDMKGGFDYKRIKEQLLIKKDNLKKFADLMVQNQRRVNETMYEYTQRIESMIPKQTTITAPINDFVLRMEPDYVIKPIEENWQTFQRVSKLKYPNNSGEKLADGTFTHNAFVTDFKSTIENGGIYSGQTTLCKTGQGSTASGNTSSTPGQLDTFIVKGEQTIQDYFNMANRHSYEADFMSPDNKINYIINKNRVFLFNKSYNPRSDINYRPNIKKLETHYMIPFGVPINTVDRIVVSPNLPKSEIDNMIALLKQKNLDIKIYDRNGKLLYDIQK